MVAGLVPSGSTTRRPRTKTGFMCPGPTGTFPFQTSMPVRLPLFQSLPDERRGYQTMRLLGRDEDLVPVFQAEAGQIEREMVPVGHHQTDALDGVDCIQDRLAHRVQSVLDRFAAVLRERLEQGVLHGAPGRPEFDLRVPVLPRSGQGCRQQPVACFRKRGVLISWKSGKGRMGRLHDDEIRRAGGDSGAGAVPCDHGCACLRATTHEGIPVLALAARDASPEMLDEVYGYTRQAIVLRQKVARES